MGNHITVKIKRLRITNKEKSLLCTNWNNHKSSWDPLNYTQYKSTMFDIKKLNKTTFSQTISFMISRIPSLCSHTTQNQQSGELSTIQPHKTQACMTT